MAPESTSYQIFPPGKVPFVTFRGDFKLWRKRGLAERKRPFGHAQREAEGRSKKRRKRGILGMLGKELTIMRRRTTDHGQRG
jgi:hypothetical protein